MSLLNNKILVFDTEYDTNPKRLLALAYKVYNNGKKISEDIAYIKHNPDVFKVDEEGRAFPYHKLTNKFLQENGKELDDVLKNFYEVIKNVDIILGQNVMVADIDIIRRESIGINMWFDNFRPEFLNKKILDTMKAFKNLHPDKSASLDNIYKFLKNKEMKDHHNALMDCKNTFSCFKIMCKDEKYLFENERMKFNEDILNDFLKIKKHCSLCNNKISEFDNCYKFKNNEFIKEQIIYKLINNNYLKRNRIICKKCFSNLELSIHNNEDKLIKITKIKNEVELVNNFFEIIGKEKTSVYLKVDFKDKEEVSSLGGRWDYRKRSWYCIIPNNDKNEIKKFKKWIPVDD
jgi:inhibitor of KinA sporulation pathway (predicted exonuclease)